MTQVLRPFTTSTASLYPRSGPRGWSPSASEPPDDPASQIHEDDDDFPDDLSEAGLPPGADPPPLPDSFSSVVTSIVPPTRTDSPLPDDLRPLLAHVLTTFLPANQPCTPTLVKAQTGMPGVSGPFAFHNGMPATIVEEDGGDQEDARTAEAVLALVTPFEGGKHYVLDAVQRVASEVDAEVLRFDLALGLGLDGSAAPLASTGDTAPELPQSVNPLLQTSPRQSPTHDAAPSGAQQVMEDEGGEDGEDEPEGRGSSAMVVMPWPGRVPGLPGMPSIAPGRPAVGIKEDWVAFFDKVLNRDSSEPDDPSSSNPRKRIIFLESPEAMSATFDVWWPSLVEAVRRRRRGAHLSDFALPQKKGSKQKAAPPHTLSHPTTIILGSAPSLLLPHTSSVAPFPSTQPSGTGQHPIHPMLQEIAERFGGVVEAKEVGSDAPPLWWGSEEFDQIGRMQREQKRLSALVEDDKGASALLPCFGPRLSRTPRRQAVVRHSLFEMLAAQAGRGPGAEDKSTANVNSIVWKTLPIIPQKRMPIKELLERFYTRSLTSAALLARAVDQLGGSLVDPLSILSLVRVRGEGASIIDSARKEVNEAQAEESGKKVEAITEKLRKDLNRARRNLTTSKTSHAPEQSVERLLDNVRKAADKGWHNAVKSWVYAQHLGSSALGRVLTTRHRQGAASESPVSVKWTDIMTAWQAEQDEDATMKRHIKRHLPRRPASATPVEDPPGQPLRSGTVTDTVVERIKKAKDLSTHERRLLSCIVDTSKLSATTFEDVHLPYKTIDAIRTLISLPLLFPEAFQGGVLKDHSTTGALLFGPPGTGKTLLARAVASESGARMLAVQPSDVNDKYFGEGEKLVKAVFGLARRLSPCVVFLDEVDALFGARSARGGGFGNKAHDQLLTEFMQEMDGLSSAGANRDKRVVVIGATNRPFDLDDAVLRRLPRRLLVDLPGPEDRIAILKILLRDEELGSDVDLDRIAKDTDGFSGSDLKHLCVSAALSAVKDMVEVPWRKARADAEAASSPIPAASSNTDVGAREDLVVLPQDTEVFRQEEAVPQPVTSALSGPSQNETEHAGDRFQIMAEDDDKRSSRPAADTGSQPQTSESAAGRSPSESTTSEDETNDATSDETPNLGQRRILQFKHFEVALAEIRPSSSEEGSLPELRKWAEQFGEGGTQRGRKKGFGKGFGFGEVGNRDSGYGKVAQDE